MTEIGVFNPTLNGENRPTLTVSQRREPAGYDNSYVWRRRFKRSKITEIKIKYGPTTGVKSSGGAVFLCAAFLIVFECKVDIISVVDRGVFRKKYVGMKSCKNRDIKIERTIAI